MHRYVNMLREFSVPLLAGVALALAWANIAPDSYQGFLHSPFIAGLDFHFVTNDIFMAFFFGIAAVEITQSCLPGGDLNPPRKAVTPLIATAGGVIGPVLVYLAGNRLFGSPAYLPGWGIPTATDIALGWMGARLVFGDRHPAIPFLLLLAVADDAVGMGIIAVFYHGGDVPVAPAWLLLTAAGMAFAWTLRRLRVRSYWPYLLAGGGASWFGLYLARLHPALALVFIVPFLPAPPRERGRLFEEDPADRSPLATFEHEWKVVVDFGLFMFGLANAGVALSAVGTGSWLVLSGLVIGKCLGISLAGWGAERAGFALPDGVRLRELFLVSLVAAVGFTVSLFIAGEAFSDPALRAQAKMGALLSIGVIPLAWGAGKLLRRPG